MVQMFMTGSVTRQGMLEDDDKTKDLYGHWLLHKRSSYSSRRCGDLQLGKDRSWYTSELPVCLIRLLMMPDLPH